MNNIEAINQLEDLKSDRLSFVYNNELDKVFLEDIKAISLGIEALKKCLEIKDKTFCCRMCGKELKTWRSIQKGFGPVCEKRYLQNVHKNQQITMEELTKKEQKIE